jgi:hypothetical protein
METKQCQTQAEEKIDRATTMKGWIVANAISLRLEAKRIVAIAMIAGVVEEGVLSISKRNKTVTKKTTGISTRDPTKSKKKLLKEESLLIELQEGVMVTEKKTRTKEVAKIREEDVAAMMTKGAAEVAVVVTMTREAVAEAAADTKSKRDQPPKNQTVHNTSTQETR